MMKKKKKVRLKIGNVLILFLFLMIVGGGVIIINHQNSLKKKEKNTSLEVQQKENHQEDIKKTTKDLEKAPVNSLAFDQLSDGEYVTEKGYTLTIKNKTAYIEGNVIANKTYGIPDNYQPEDPYRPVTGERCNDCIDKKAMEAFQLMQSDAKALGLNIYIASGYRSYQYQVNLYDRYVSTSGKEKADTYSSRPGHSEHQTGMCFDLNSIEDSFANTNEGKWVHENAYRYGFVIRFPKGAEKYTGYQYESWHLRYVGENLAKKLYQNDEYISLEEYYGITSTYE